MAKELRIRRGTTAQHSTFTGAPNEVTADTTKKTLVLHDGTTVGGVPMARENLSNVPAGSVATAMLADGAITTAKIANGAVVTAGLADGAVTTAKIANASVTTAKLSATGTASSTTFLRGDGTWATAGGTPSTTDVLNATAGASVGAVGTYAFLGESGSVTTQAGGTRAGSALYYAGVAVAGSYSNRTGGNNSAIASATAVSGTWRCMGVSIYWSNCFANFFPATLWLRIS